MRSAAPSAFEVVGQPLLFADKVLDARAGVVAKWQNLPRYNDEPALWHLSAVLQVSGSIGEGGDDSATAGGSSRILAHAKAKLAGESVERYALAVGAASVETIETSWERLRSRGENALDPATLAIGDGSSDVRRRSEICPWVRAKSLGDGLLGWVPEQLVSVPHRYEKGEPCWRAPVSTGAAAHRSYASAVQSAVAEVQERDAFQSAWLLQAPLRLVTNRNPNRELLWLQDACRRSRLGLDLRFLPTASSAYVCVMAVVRDRTGIGPPSAVGAKAVRISDRHPRGLASPECRAAVGAIEEALQVRRWMRRILDREGIMIVTGPVDTLLTRARHWLTADPNDQLDKWLEAPGPNVHGARPDGSQPPEDAWVVDLTPRLPKTVAHLGWSAVKVISPSMQPLNLTESASDLSPAALRRAAVASGMNGDLELCLRPHPFL